MKFISDPGHGWLEVSLEEYPDAIECGTGYGFIDRGRGIIFLEEDVEAPAFIERHPEVLKMAGRVMLDEDAPLRKLPRNEKRLEAHLDYA